MATEERFDDREGESGRGVGAIEEAVPASVDEVESRVGADPDEGVMEHHALEATQGQRYAEMGRFLTESGQPTSDEAKAAKDPKTGQPVENGLRNLWVNETALATALNVSFFAEMIGVFSIVMGIALLLTGIGFLVLTLGGLERGRAPETAPAPATAKT